MTVIKIGSDYKKRGFTQIDNLFLSDYVGKADGTDVKIYMVGLFLAETDYSGDYIQRISTMLKVSEDRVKEGFAYWDKQGLVEMTSGGDINYLSVKEPVTPIIKYNAQKFKTFTEETVRIFPEKILSPNEYNRYFEFMTVSGMEVNSMLLIMQYCKDMGGGRTGTDYVLAVAKAWAEEGLLKEKQIINRIDDMENNREDMHVLFDTLGIKRAVSVEDRHLYTTWTNGYGYRLDAILTAARSLKKRGGMEKLDNLIKELQKASAFSSAEIEEYLKNKKRLRELCIQICKDIGVYYADTEGVAEVYVAPWLNLGFDDKALIKIAKFCFIRNARNLDSMEQMVKKFAKQGLFTEEDISSYVARQIELDRKIKEIYEKCNYVGAVGQKDRENYRNWIEWGFDEDVIMAVAERFADKNFPMSGINRALGQLKLKNIFDLDGALNHLDKTETSSVKSSENTEYTKHQYTEEQLKKAFVNFDDWD